MLLLMEFAFLVLAFYGTRNLGLNSRSFAGSVAAIGGHIYMWSTYFTNISGQSLFLYRR